MKRILALAFAFLLIFQNAFADDLAVTPGTGATVRSVNKSGKLTQSVVLDLGGAGAESLATTAIPVTFTGSTDVATQTTLAALNTKVTACNTGAVTVSSAPVTHVIADSGTVTAVTSITNAVAVTNAGITSIDGKIPALGQALAAASVPVILPSATITTLTPPAAITGFATSTKQSDKSQITQICDGAGNVVGAATGNALDINIKSGNPTTIACTNTGTFAVQSTDSVNAKTILSIKAAYTASQTAATVLTPTSGKKFVITDIVISASAAGTVYLFDNTDSATTAITPTLSLAANGGFVNPYKGLYTAAATNNLIKYTSGSGAAGSIMVYYYEV